MNQINYRKILSKISDQILRIFPLILILFLVFLINRLLFFSLFSDTPFTKWVEIIKGFVLGLRFDSATIMYGLSVPILLTYLGLLIPSNIYLLFVRIFSKIWLTMILCIIFFIFGIDVYFYDFYQDHLNIIFFDMFEDDTKAVILSIWKNYPVFWILLGLLGMSILFYNLLGRIFAQYLLGSRGAFKSAGILLGSFLIFSIMARASFGLFPINMMDAAYTNDAFLNKLAPNPVFTFEKAIEARMKQKNAIPFWRQHKFREKINSAYLKSSKEFMGFETEEIDIYSKDFKRETKENETLKSSPPHVVVAVMEGFGSWILDYETEQFQISCGVSDWMKKSIYFDHFIQAGFGSIQNLIATLLSIPPIPNTIPISQQKYSVVPFETALAKQYQKNGYETTFVYGGKLSWQRLGDFVPHQGFHHVLGEGDMDSDTPKTDWGVYDEYLFQFVYDKLVSAQTPQFILFFTTTNHPPFELPSSFNPPPLELNNSLRNMIRGNEELAQKRFAAYQYSSCYLNQFLNDIYSNPDLENTITAITADHNLQGIRNYSEEEMFHKYRIPFFILSSNDLLNSPQVVSRFGSHVDIAPTLIELTLPKTKYLSFGKNLLAHIGQSVVNQNGIIFTQNYVLNYNFVNRQSRGFYQWNSPNKWVLNRIENHMIEMELLELMTAYVSSASYYLEEGWNNYSDAIMQNVSRD